MNANTIAMTRIIGAIGEADFAAQTAAALCAFSGFDLAAVVLHHSPRDADLLFDNFACVGARRGLETYVRATRRINPMFPGGAQPRAVRASDYGAPGELPAAHRDIVRAEDEELGYRTVGWPRRQEEIALHVPLGGATVEIGLYRRRDKEPAPPALLDALAAMGEPVAAAFERNEQLGSGRVVCALPELTVREAQVRDLLLLGCSSEAIALRLSISRHTVKDHRKAIFRKLGIASLAELFAHARRSPSPEGYSRPAS